MKISYSWRWVFMNDQLKKIFLAGIGSVAFTYEKASKLVDEMVEKGKLTVDEGKELSEDFKKTVMSKKDEIMPLTKEDLNRIFGEMDLATKTDLYEVKERLNRIEDTLYNEEERFIEIEEEVDEEKK
jgi:polyhydroxyalkanoate synthesis regulator phasin